MTAPKADPQRAGRKPGPRIPCGGCFALLTAREWKGHFAGCTGRGKQAKFSLVVEGRWRVVGDLEDDGSLRYAVYGTNSRRIGPWRETPIAAVRDCPNPLTPGGFVALWGCQIKGGKA